MAIAAPLSARDCLEPLCVQRGGRPADLLESVYVKNVAARLIENAQEGAPALQDAFSEAIRTSLEAGLCGMAGMGYQILNVPAEVKASLQAQFGAGPGGESVTRLFP